MSTIFNILRRGPRPDKDASAIQTLRRQSISGPVRLRHFLYFSLDHEAAFAAASLREQQFDVVSNKVPMGDGTLVLAKRNEPLDVDHIHALRVQLTALALSQKGEYDGWEPELASGRVLAGARH
jgi:hypothetical protein